MNWYFLLISRQLIMVDNLIAKLTPVGLTPFELGILGRIYFRYNIYAPVLDRIAIVVSVCL
jgi:hypothetical protein